MRLFLISIFLLASSVCFALRQNVYLLKDDGSEVAVKDSADFIRVVSEPDSGSVLFNVIEYYPNGKRKRVGRSKTIDPIALDGIWLTFYKNGQRKSTENYESGKLVEGSDEYYPNGQLFIHKEHTLKESIEPKTKFHYKTSSFTIQAVYDSLGTVKVKDGNGIYSGYSEEDKGNLKVTEEGPIKNGLRSGIWKGFDKQYNTTFEEVYENGELISGKVVCNGLSTTYTKNRVEDPKFPGGDYGFNRFLSRAIRYPAREREKNIQGKVILSFIVNKEGAIINIKVIRSVSAGIDNEAVRALRSSPPWVPGTVYGSIANRTYSVPIGFALSRE
jgi:TonB family protein